MSSPTRFYVESQGIFIGILVGVKAQANVLEEHEPTILLEVVLNKPSYDQVQILAIRSPRRTYSCRVLRSLRVEQHGSNPNTVQFEVYVTSVVRNPTLTTPL